MHLETILWLNKQIDDINAKSTVIGEMLLGETDSALIKKFDKKLQELEKELLSIGHKIDMEKKLMADLL